MIRLTWRQFRPQALIGAGALLLAAIVLLVTGPHLAHVYNTYVASCRATGSCSANPVLHTYQFLRTGLPLFVVAVPALIGVFWGAPLVAHELETGTYRLVWTQSVSRGRWLAIKLAVVGMTSVAVGGVLALMASWWADPVYKVNQDLFTPGTFSTRGLVPFGYAAFAFALGICAGVIVRKTLPAMAITLVGFVGARLAVTEWIRPHFSAPAHLNLALGTAGRSVAFLQGSSGLTVVPPSVTLPNAWIYSTALRDGAAHGPTLQYLKATCPTVVATLAPHPGNSPQNQPSPQPFLHCMAAITARFHEVVTYQPASRYWPFQWYETAVFAIASLVLIGVSFWWIHRRVA